MTNIKFFGLGGLDENGKNMYCLEINNDIFILEAGLKYPNESTQLGVEKIIPDFTYLQENKERVKAIFISHGHMDVMGALPELVKVVKAPIYCTAFTEFMLKRTFKKEKTKLPKCKIIGRNDDFKIGNTTFKTFGVTQSIPDSFGLAIQTDDGQVVYTSEFIFDYSPIMSFSDTDLGRIADIGKSGVLMMMSESVGASKIGHTAPKHELLPIIEDKFALEDRIIISVYNQNVYHIIEVIELAKKYNKKIYVYSDGLREIINELDKLGYYKVNKGLFITKDQFSNDLTNIVIIVGGIGQQVFNRMHNISNLDDDIVEINSNDIAIIASPAIPGTEKKATRMENDLFKEVKQVIHIKSKILAPMHASSEDLKMMMYLLKPKFIIPVKGEYRHLLANANLAMNMGYQEKNIILLDNGQFLELENKKIVSTKKNLKLNDLLIDGNKELDSQGMVLKDRGILSTDGVIVCGISLDINTKQIIGGPDVQSRGVIYLKEADYILKELNDIMKNTVQDMVAKNKYNNSDARFEARDKMIKYINKETGKRPMVLTTIIEIKR